MRFERIRRFSKVFKRTAVVSVGVSVSYLVHSEYEHYKNFSYLEAELKDLGGVDLLRHYVYDFAYRNGLMHNLALEKFLRDMNSVNKKVRNGSLHFIKTQFDWLETHPDIDNISRRIQRSQIIHSLARLDSFHENLFIEPKNPHIGIKLSEKLLNIFKKLPSTKMINDAELFTPCVKFFTEIAMHEIEEIWDSIEKSESRRDMIGDNMDSSFLSPDPQSEDAGILMLLKALRRYCEDPEKYKLINLDKIFEILIDVILNEHSLVAAKSLEMKQIALRCLANLACDEHLKPRFVHLGVHKLLRRCADDHPVYFNDNELKFNQLFCRFQAVRALANLDTDNDESAVFADGVFQVAPKGRVDEKLKYDVVFVHGLLGSAASTWTTKVNICENKNTVTKRLNWVDHWITRDLGKDPEDCRVLSVDYETAIMFDQHQCPFDLENRNIAVLAKELGQKLKSASVGERNTVFVCYSMGGLVTKKMLQLYPELGAKLKGVVFLATPHFGTPFVKSLIDHKSYISSVVRKFTTPDIVLFGGLGEDLESLNNAFIKMAEEKSLPVMSWGEELHSNWGIKIHIVPLETANPGIGTFLTSRKDHDGMVMPIDEVDPIYSQSLDFIRECLKA